MTIRAGVGFDVHPLVPGRRLVLGGVTIDHPRGLAGHSDADALLHAIADAVLGAAALGDIGRYFPPDNPAWKDADSFELLRTVAGHVRAAGWKIGNVDATVLAQEPRIAPHASAMVARIAEALEIEKDGVNVKATTMEGLGSIGRAEGVAAWAIATIER